MVNKTDERFWAKVEKLPGDGCWFWRGAHKAHGYGHLNRGGRWLLAHRYAYEILIGPIPAGLELDHLCYEPSCVRPAHLEPVSRAENAKRAAERRTSACPAGHPYTPENTYRWKGGNQRSCRTCHMLKERDRRQAETRKCAVKGCRNKRHARGLCRTHWGRVRQEEKGT